MSLARLIYKNIKSKLKKYIPIRFYIMRDYYKYNNRFFSKKNIVSFSDRVFSWKLDKKLSDYAIYVDKYKVRDFVSSKAGEHYLPKLLKVCTTADDFNISEMPQKFVVKLNNGCGFNLVVTDKNKYSDNEIRHLIKQWLKSDYYATSKERQYKNIKQVVLCEEYIESNGCLKDYKFYCINGDVEFVQVIAERKNGNAKHNYYSKEWAPLNVSRQDFVAGEVESKPRNFEEAVELAKMLSKSFSFVRVDLYIEEKIYFGELTFTPGNGYIRFIPSSFDRELAKKMKLEFRG